MAFLPSFFQKSLLRHLLTYLDFIESEDLDLDSLGVSIGRRSVVELKDVGLRIQVRPAYLALYQGIPPYIAVHC